MMCKNILLLLLVTSWTASLWPVGEAPVWPIADTPFPGKSNYVEFVQPTSSGKPESALFGCVRNDGNRFHEADDIAPVKPRRRGEATDPVVAVHDGIIAHVNRIAGNSSYGRYVVIEHPGLTLPVYTLYAHLATVEPGWSSGDPVKAGQPLGIMGRSAGGYSIPKSRSHLHFEIGLRLGGSFQRWYDLQGYSSANQHGNFNGMNLMSWDPLDYFGAFDEGPVETVIGYFNTIPPAVLLHVRKAAVPDFLIRYPQLLLEGCGDEERVGWEIMLSAWGLPLSFRALEAEALRGVGKTGEISVLAVDHKLLQDYHCRRIISFDKDQVSLGSGGRRVLELLFTAD